jgi:hypothetical protein
MMRMDEKFDTEQKRLLVIFWDYLSGILDG